MKGKPHSVRLAKDLEPAVRQWLEVNKMEFSALVDLALRDFIFERKSIELAPVPLADGIASAMEMMRRHKKLLEDLK